MISGLETEVGSQGVMIVLIPSLKGVILRCDGELTLGSIGDGSQGVMGAVLKVGSQGVMIVLIPSLKGWDGSQGVMIVLIPSLKGDILSRH